MNNYLKVLIVEDEQLAANNLEMMLKEVFPEVQIMAKLDTVVETITWLSAHQADLILLDIHLADGSSFGIFDEIEVTTPIIFTTAYDQYAIRAFKVNSIDYLLKPFSKEELQQAVDKFKRLQGNTRQETDISSLIDILNPQRDYKKRFIVHYGDKIKSIKSEDIAMFYVDEKNTFIHTFNQHHYGYDQSLDKVELLLDPEQFFRINRQLIINIDSIDTMYTLSKSRMGLHLKPKAPFEALVSFNRMKSFRQWINK